MSRTDAWGRRPAVLLWILWAALVVGAYYLQAWRLVAEGPGAWFRHLREVASVWGPLIAALGMLVVARRVVRPAGAGSGGNGGGRRPDVTRILIAGVILGALAVVLAGPRTLALSFPGFPGLGEALVRAGRGIAGSIVVVAAAQPVGAALLVLLRWHAGSSSERWLVQTACGLGVLAYLLLGLAAVGLFTPTVVWAVCGLLAATTAGWIVGGLIWPVLSRLPAGDVGDLVHPHPATAPVMEERLWRAVAIFAVGVAGVGALAPEREYDALWYHLTFPRAWLAAGRLVDFPAEYVSLYPMTWELLFGAGLALGGPVAAKILHFACLLMAGGLVVALVRHVAPHASPWLAGALFVTMPTVLWEATTAYVDLALAVYVTLAVYGLVRYETSRDRPWLGVVAVSLGFALGTKHLGVLASVVCVAVLAVIILRTGHRWTGVLAAATLTGAVAFLVAGPWYVRSWVATGNPVFPEFYGVFGGPTDRWDQQTEEALNQYEARFGRPRTPVNLIVLPWDMTVHAAKYGGTLGPLPLLLLPALLLAPGTGRAPRLVAISAGYMALWASPISNFQMRFLVPIAPVIAVLAADGYARAREAASAWPRSSMGTPALAAGVAVLMLANLPPNLPLHERDRVGFEGWLTHVIRAVPFGVVTGRQSEARYLTAAVPSYGAWQYINTHLPRDARILTFTGGDDYYSERPRLSSDTVAARPATWGAPAGQGVQALDALRQLGITHILFDRRELRATPPAALAIAQPSFLAEQAQRAYEDRYVTLYSVRSDAGRVDPRAPP